jgi:hypothetical protein
VVEVCLKKKKLDILPVPCEYIFSLMMFTVTNLDNFQVNSAVHLMNTRAKHHLRRPTVNLSCIHKGFFTVALRYLIVCPPYILKLKQEKKPKFMVALIQCLIAHTFYSLGKFLSTIQISFPNINNFTYSN